MRPVEQVAGLGVADVVEGVGVSIDAAAAGEEQAEFAACQLQNRSRRRQPARSGRGNIARIIQALQYAVILEVDAIGGLGEPQIFCAHPRECYTIPAF